jgi:hypothetical protein
LDVLKRHVRAVGIRKYNVTLQPSERPPEGNEGGGPVAEGEKSESDDVKRKKQTWAEESASTPVSNDASPVETKRAAKNKSAKNEAMSKTDSEDSETETAAIRRKEQQDKRRTPSKMLMTFLRTSLANLKEGQGSSGDESQSPSPPSGSPSSSGRRRSTLSLGRKSGSVYAASRSAPLAAVEERPRSVSVAQTQDGDDQSRPNSLPSSPQRVVSKEPTRRKKRVDGDDAWKGVFGGREETKEASHTASEQREGSETHKKQEEGNLEAKADLAASTRVTTSPRHKKKKETKVAEESCATTDVSKPSKTATKKTNKKKSET